MVEFKNGMIIETRNGSLYLYTENFVSVNRWFGEKVFVRIGDNDTGYLTYSMYNEDGLMYDNEEDDFDIMKVWIPDSPVAFASKYKLKNKKDWELVWERKEEKKEELPLGDVLDILNDNCDGFEITYEDGRFWSKELV